MGMGRPLGRALLAAVTVFAAGAVTVVGIQLLVQSGWQTGRGSVASPSSQPSRALPTPAVPASATAMTSPAASPSADALDPNGILLIQVGEQVQAIPANEPQAMAFDGLIRLAMAHPIDLGYPWIDPGSGELVLSAATVAGRTLLEATGATLEFPYRMRDVTYSHAELQQFQDDATRLVAAGVSDADLIYEIVPDQRDNKTMIVISEMSRPLLEALAERFPPDAIAIQVDPRGGPIGP